MNVGYQLYSAREDAQHDFEGTLSQLAHMGYEGIEFAGFFGWEAKDLAKLLKKLRVKPVGSHVPFKQILTDPKAVIDYHKALGAEYIAVPGLDDESRPGAPGFAAALRAMYRFGRLCSKNGLTFLYHNHDTEFVPLSGQPALDFLYDALPPKLLQAEFDVCWVKRAGFDPVETLARYAGRIPLIHLQDYADEPGYAFKPVGYGCQNVGAITAAARKGGTRWLIVEQDDSPDRPPLEAAKLSLGTVQALLRD